MPSEERVFKYSRGFIEKEVRERIKDGSKASVFFVPKEHCLLEKNPFFRIIVDRNFLSY